MIDGFLGCRAHEKSFLKAQLITQCLKNELICVSQASQECCVLQLLRRMNKMGCALEVSLAIDVWEIEKRAIQRLAFPLYSSGDQPLSAGLFPGVTKKTASAV